MTRASSQAIGFFPAESVSWDVTENRMLRIHFTRDAARSMTKLQPIAGEYRLAELEHVVFRVARS